MLRDIFDKKDIYLKKELGQFLTPPIIVDYMCNESLNLLDYNSNKPILILDPACGTGRFMLGVADYMQKRNITNYIMFNIDIDPEFTKKTVEHAILYNIPAIIIEGNTLTNDFSKSWEVKNGVVIETNPKKYLFLFNSQNNLFFDNMCEFPEVLNDDGDFVGFDVVIGNPPYIDSESMSRDGTDNVREFIANQYNWSKGNWDIYISFFERGLMLLKTNGFLIFITPDKWLSKPFGTTLRAAVIDYIVSILIAGREIFEAALVDSIVTLISRQKAHALKIYKYLEDYQFIGEFFKKDISPPYLLDSLFAPHRNIILKIESNKTCLKEYVMCQNACATSDAYKLKPLIQSLSNKNMLSEDFFKVINTGTIDKYIPKWGNKYMTYLKDKYMFPVINKNSFIETFPNSYGKKAAQRKLIIKGLNLLDACLDFKGEYIPGKSTLVIISDNTSLLLFLSAILNSPIMQFYMNEKFSASSYNGGVTFTKEMINDIPVCSTDNQQVILFVGYLFEIARVDSRQDCFEFFKSLVNAIIYELYFSVEVISKKAEILKYLPKLPSLMDSMSAADKSEVIEMTYKELSSPNHPVSIAMKKMKTIPEVRIIEGLDK